MLHFMALLPLVVGNPLAPGHCTDKLRQEWPLDLDNTELSWRKNSLNNSKPAYSLSVEKNNVRPRPGYETVIQLSGAGQPIHRFLISAIPEEGNKCGAGRLHSRGEISEPVSYTCPTFLQEKHTTNISSLEFGWTAPECGCVQISANVLDSENNIYTFQDDAYKGLRLIICVRDALSYNAATAEIEADHVEAADSEEEVDQIYEADLDKLSLIQEADLDKDNLEEETDNDHLDLIEETDPENIQTDFLPSILPTEVKRQKNTRSKVGKKRLGKRWCCRQGKAERRKKDGGTCGQNLATEVLEFGSFKFGIGKDLCENTYTRCCSNGKLRMTSLSRKIKKLKKIEKSKKWKKMMLNRPKKLNRAKRNKNKDDLMFNNYVETV